MIIPKDKLKKLVLKSGLVDPIELDQAEKSSTDLNKPLKIKPNTYYTCVRLLFSY